MAVAEPAYGNAGNRVEIALTVRVPQPAAFAALEGDGQPGIGVHYVRHSLTPRKRKRRQTRPPCNVSLLSLHQALGCKREFGFAAMRASSDSDGCGKMTLANRTLPPCSKAPPKSSSKASRNPVSPSGPATGRSACAE